MCAQSIILGLFVINEQENERVKGQLFPSSPAAQPPRVHKPHATPRISPYLFSISQQTILLHLLVARLR